MENLNGKGKLVFGSLMIGAVVGATIGVLFAPHKGSKTRNNIANSFKKSANTLKQELNEDGQYLKDKAIKAERFLEDKISKASTSIKDKANELLHSSSDHEMNTK
jgi:gas vesicle protein